jgi:DNA-binding MarR family transcriptional regulator
VQVPVVKEFVFQEVVFEGIMRGRSGNVNPSQGGYVVKPRDHIDLVRSAAGLASPDTTTVEITSRLFRLCAHYDQLVTPLYARHGLMRVEFDLLWALERAGDSPLTPTRLAARQMCSSGTLSNRLEKLERLGLLTRQADPSDRRGVLLAITEHGRAIVNELNAARERIDALLIPGLTLAQRRALVDLLRTSLVAAEQIAQPGAASETPLSANHESPAPRKPPGRRTRATR